MKLILVHGLGQGAQAWSETQRYLNEAMDVQCPELYLGAYGDDFSYQGLYKGFEAYCGQFKEPVALCGLSLGGILSLNYAIAHSDKVQKLILIGAQYKMPKHLLYLQNLVFHCLPDRVFHNFKLSKSKLIQLCESMMHLDFSHSLQDIACETLIVCGEKDLANLPASKRLSRMLRKATMIKIPDSGHEVNEEQAQKLAEVICKFLQV